MSSGSYFTIYRKYPAKLSPEELKALKQKYAAVNREHDYSEQKKDDSEYEKDIPCVMDMTYGVKSHEYDEVEKTWKDVADHSISGMRDKFKHILTDDGSHLDMLLQWDFGSSFSCLRNEWNMNGKWSRSQHVITVSEAQQMLQACKYLLSGKWSDEFEAILDNKWIKIFATGNDCDEYWKYVNRGKKSKADDYEVSESNEAVEFQLNKTSHALEAFLTTEKDWSESDCSELMLVYSAW